MCALFFSEVRSQFLCDTDSFTSKRYLILDLEWHSVMLTLHIQIKLIRFVVKRWLNVTNPINDTDSKPVTEIATSIEELTYHCIIQYIFIWIVLFIFFFLHRSMLGTFCSYNFFLNFHTRCSGNTSSEKIEKEKDVKK